MENSKTKLPIGVFDSGIGGISVLAEIIKILPDEEFLYFADTLHSPYGIKPEGSIQSLSVGAAGFLASKGIKSLVIACNTATSVAIDTIRNRYTFPVIGMEPAVKPATNLATKGKIIVMATPVTLRSQKFTTLLRNHKHQADIIPLPCAELVEIIEQHYPCEREIGNYLTSLFSPIKKDDITTIVLGCTHYVLIKKEIANVVGDNVTIIDGNPGTAKRLKTVLYEEHLLINTVEETPKAPLKAKVTFYASKDGNETIGRLKQVLINEGTTYE
ncbi:MAG: glutamate racemase [wastewater metagenome]|nr:glutamate racemase [Candidatus Loosdrechtia aerotolerans]